MQKCLVLDTLKYQVLFEMKQGVGLVLQVEQCKCKGSSLPALELVMPFPHVQSLVLSLAREEQGDSVDGTNHICQSKDK